MSVEGHIEMIQSAFEVEEKTRRDAQILLQSIINNSSKAVRQMHRGDLTEAERLIGEASNINKQVVAMLHDHPVLYYAGATKDSQKEYAEAAISLAIFTGSDIPSPHDLQIEFPAYVNGLGEAVGELKRHMLDIMREGGTVEEAKKYFAWMDRICSLLADFTQHDVITGGLRHTLDMVRGVTEKSREDLTLFISQERLAEIMKT